MSENKAKDREVKVALNDELPDAALDMVSGGYPARVSPVKPEKGVKFG